jgi:RNA polymerase subunit RPABC4/transcription elongation factor Spt4
MERTGSSDRRSGHDRRQGEDPSYTGPERRRGKYRRRADFIACRHCHKICDANGRWTPSATPPDTLSQFRAGICPACSSKGFTPFYPEDGN